MTERRLLGAAELMGLVEQPYQTYATEVARLLEALCAGFDPDRCNVLAAHLYISGATLAGSERQLTIGDLFAVAPQAIPPPRSTSRSGTSTVPSVAGVAAPARYAGLCSSTSERAGQQKGLVFVDLEPGKPAQVREVPIDAGRKLLDVRGRSASSSSTATLRTRPSSASS